MRLLFKRILTSFLCLIITYLPGFAETESSQKIRNVLCKGSLNDFTSKTYDSVVEEILASFEAGTGKELVPGEKKSAGLKVFTRSGPGISTSVELVRAVILALEKRGFNRRDIFIFDQSEEALRDAGFMPLLSKGGNLFDGVPVYALENQQFYNDVWFYDSPLPRRIRKPDDISENFNAESEAVAEDRHSYLPVPLLLDADIWINLPMVVDDPVLGISGALANITLWNVSNHWRFMTNPASAPAAVAEIASVPEMKRGLCCTLLSLERFQYLGGPEFNSMYTKSEKEVWCSSNPVLLDYMMYEKINRLRLEIEMPLIVPRPLIFDYCEAMSLGSWDPKAAEIFQVKP